MLISLKNYWDSDAVKSLLAECMWTDDQRVNEELKRYLAAEGCELFGCFINGELAGITGISCAAAHEVEIRHLAVQKNWRGRTIGSNMIAEIAGWEQVEVLRAETDQDAVGFYSKAGFEIHSLGAKYPGVERFECVLRTRGTTDISKSSL
ncbi:GNAT family N-acetyltransferase [Paenibacillus sp. FSL R10-2771]|uniref:GNAT family N-acetyltransferase n=1 Tax=Paenibacillus sp. FSL R10-2771 TaxID=2954693 RepID=UPI0030FBF01C